MSVCIYIGSRLEVIDATHGTINIPTPTRGENHGERNFLSLSLSLRVRVRVRVRNV